MRRDLLVGPLLRRGQRGALQDVALSGGHAYVADDAFGLRVFDLEDPAAPALVGELATGDARSVAVVGTRVYLAETRAGAALRVIDAADPAAPREIGSFPTEDANAVAVDGDLAVYAERSSVGVGLHIVDVSDPAAIQEVGAYGGGSDGCSDARDVALTGSLAVVACASAGFHILDLGDPARPVRRAVVPGFALSAAAWDRGAALGDSAGVQIVDLADPAAPVTRARLPTSEGVRALVAPGDGQLLAVCSSGGIYRFQLP
jgi:hypothetical protein